LSARKQAGRGRLIERTHSRGVNAANPIAAHGQALIARDWGRWDVGRVRLPRRVKKLLAKLQRCHDTELAPRELRDLRRFQRKATRAFSV
jgi:hypothetical protein